MIEGEALRNPLSDSNIVQRLQDEGLLLARRTIAKYREELRIPTSPSGRGSVDVEARQWPPGGVAVTSFRRGSLRRNGDIGRPPISPHATMRIGVTMHAKHNRLTVLHIATLNKPIRSDLGYGPVETTSRSHVSAG